MRQKKGQVVRRLLSGWQKHMHNETKKKYTLHTKQCFFLSNFCYFVCAHMYKINTLRCYGRQTSIGSEKKKMREGGGGRGEKKNWANVRGMEGNCRREKEPEGTTNIVCSTLIMQWFFLHSYMYITEFTVVLSWTAKSS